MIGAGPLGDGVGVEDGGGEGVRAGQLGGFGFQPVEIDGEGDACGEDAGEKQRGEKAAVGDAQEPATTFVGRLAAYRYYNMDQVVGMAPAEFEKVRVPR